MRGEGKGRLTVLAGTLKLAELRLAGAAMKKDVDLAAGMSVDFEASRRAASRLLLPPRLPAVESNPRHFMDLWQKWTKLTEILTGLLTIS